MRVGGICRKDKNGEREGKNGKKQQERGEGRDSSSRLRYLGIKAERLVSFRWGEADFGGSTPF